MPKTKLSKKEVQRLKQKHQYAQATELRLLAGQLRNQHDLDTLLLQEPLIARRQMLFNFVKPFLKFSNPQLPTYLERPRIILA